MFKLLVASYMGIRAFNTVVVSFDYREQADAAYDAILANSTNRGVYSTATKLY